MPSQPPTNRSSDDSTKVLRALADLAQNPDSTAAITALRVAIRPVRVQIQRNWQKVPGFRMQDVENNAFLEALKKYEPDRGSFTSYYRRVFVRRIQDVIKSADYRRRIDSGINDELDSAEAFIEQFEIIGAMKDFLIVAIHYAKSAELRAIQGLCMGEDYAETAKRYKVNRPQIWRGANNIFALAELYAKGEVPFPPTPAEIKAVRRKVAAMTLVKNGKRKASASQNN